jgi:hypothetical protein
MTDEHQSNKKCATPKVTGHKKLASMSTERSPCIANELGKSVGEIWDGHQINAHSVGSFLLRRCSNGTS